MLCLNPVTVLLVAVVALTPVCLGQKNAPRTAGRQQAQVQKAPRAANHPGEQILSKLQSMTPGEREKALSSLPPARRAQIEKRIQNFEKLPPAAQERRLDRLERLNSLAPQRQNQVRRSMKELNSLSDDRRKAINQELRRMSALPNADRKAHMSTEEFRNRFSPSEQQMVGDLAEILPSKN